MSALKGSLKFSVAGKELTIKAAAFESPEGWGYWIADKEGINVSIHCNGIASIDRYDGKSYFILEINYFPKELHDGTKVDLLASSSLRLPYTRREERDDE